MGPPCVYSGSSSFGPRHFARVGLRRPVAQHQPRTFRKSDSIGPDASFTLAFGIGEMFASGRPHARP